MNAEQEVKIMYDAEHIAEHVARILLSTAKYPEFQAGGVPVEVAAAVYGKDATWVRQGIEDGWLPIGHMTRSENKRNFYISPKKLWEDTGFVWKDSNNARRYD
ncbi:hypothetical protein [Lacrimispora sp. JR3]|uniref:hypothetical protein n=1 Tax=Lacrimispora sinapis TaxID=3111456 RepID=UPI0037494A55